ncbi:hypothetical protein AUJ14_03665 [Candidatus Micrarchaeota archaeon CG1_02_55_22]|nr:MAG: hypothetical protein AUJ14_03665 [Candidatus Micrarchaeota archaeon CG1_02_55_22]
MALELIEVALFAILFGVDAYGYAKLKESEREIERIERKQELGMMDRIRETKEIAADNNALLRSGHRNYSENVTFTKNQIEGGEDMDRAALMRIEKLEHELENVKYEKAPTASPELQSSLDSIEKDVADLRDDHSTLKDRFASIEDDHSSINERLSSVEHDVAELQAISARVDAIESRVDTASVDEREAIEARIAEVEKTLIEKVSSESNDKVLEKFKETYKRINDLKNRLATTEQDLASHMGETPVSEATIMQRMDDADAKLAKQIESSVKKVEETATKAANATERKLSKATSEAAATAEAAVKTAKKAASDASSNRKAVEAVEKTAKKAVVEAESNKKAVVKVEATAKKAVADAAKASRTTVVAKAPARLARKAAAKANTRKPAARKTVAKKPARAAPKRAAKSERETRVIVETVGANETTIKS